MNIDFPILNISVPAWNNEIVEELFREDEFYYSRDNHIFEKYINNHEFVDCTGKIFKVVGKSKIKKIWTLLFTSRRAKLSFQETNKHLSFPDLKNLMLNRIDNLTGEEAKNAWKLNIETFSSIDELIKGG